MWWLVEQSYSHRIEYTSKNMAYIRRNSSALILAPKLSDSGPQTSKSQKRYMNDLQSEVTKSRIAIVRGLLLRKI